MQRLVKPCKADADDVDLKRAAEVRFIRFFDREPSIHCPWDNNTTRRALVVMGSSLITSPMVAIELGREGPESALLAAPEE
jgi:hypothetical protein